MVVIEIESNSNCEAVEMRVFHNVEGPKPVARVCLQDVGQPPAWYEVTGWTVDGRRCPVVAQRVDDSGEGLAILVHGGDAGLRLRPVGAQGPWGSADCERGASYLLLADDGQSVVYDEVIHG